MKQAMAWLLAGTAVAAEPGVAGETVGKRPYEMEWANRAQDHCPPFVDFEDLAGWRAEGRDAVASFERTREQQLWGQYVGKLTYRGTGNAPEVRVTPPQPIPIRAPFDAVTLWCYGNNWSWAPDPQTPQVNLSALFADAAGAEFEVPLYRVDWTEWNLLHRRLTPDQIERVRGGAQFRAIRVTGGRNTQDRVLYFDNLAVFVERFPPLEFEPRPERGVAMFPGQSPGLNGGPGRLPFPTREETILPPNLTRKFRTSLAQEAGAWAFAYTGDDGTLTYRLRPESGRWDDLEVQWALAGRSGRGAKNEPVRFRPCVDGGAYLQTGGGPARPDRAEVLEVARRQDTLEWRCRLAAGGVAAEVTYVFRLWNKSLVVDVRAPGGQVGEVRFGRATGLTGPRLVTNPFYPAEGGRPAVAVSGPPESPLFLAGNVDWTRSNGSILWARNFIQADGVVYNGGTRYLPLTDGRRVDCYERFFLTVSPRYEETLPAIPNPVSPWKRVTGTHLWRAHGASIRAQDAEFWTDCQRWGMTEVVVTDHETGWRDGGESFTFRTRAAPGKGGDQGQFDYARLMQDQLGFVYGPYNNYTDFAPVNEFWHFDRVSRSSDNQLQHAWMRCYAPKPARAVEFCARLAPEIQRKFRFSTAYCDVHTAVAPWHRVDYDARVPGAGTFAAVFYAFGEIMFLQKQAWGGPVYSEGNYHSFYTGLTDGNYGQDQSYRPAENPWLVDFDLRRMHDLGCNFGMGSPDMFYVNVPPPPPGPGLDAWMDRFLAATVAFGHPGFLAYEGGQHHALRSYYMLQQLHSRYCLTNAVDIRYAGPGGQLLETSEAVATGAYRQSQVLTRYADGTVTAVNGSRTLRLQTRAWGRQLDLPPNGYAGWTADGAVEVLAADPGGHRSDYAATPAYLYVDGRGRFVRHPRAAGNGIGICRILPRGGHEVLLHQNAECGFAVRAGAAVALDKERREIGPAGLRAARGLVYVLPVKDAFSYVLKPETTPASRASAAAPALACERDEVFPGETVRVRGRRTHAVEIPGDAGPGQRLWFEREGAFIDFTVVPLADTETGLDGHRARLRLASHAGQTRVFEVSAGSARQTVRLKPRQSAAVCFDLGVPTEEDARVLAFEVRSGGAAQRWERGLRVERALVPLLALPAEWSKGMCLRGRQESADFGTTAAAVELRESRCGQVARQGLFMHPPWQGAQGYCFARYPGVALPVAPAAAFRAFVGKGDGSDPGDGILYRLEVEDGTGSRIVAAQATVSRHGWAPFEADLSRWAGQRVALKLVADPGPQDDPTGDWGCWAEMRLESLRPELRYALEEHPALCRHEPGPHPAPGLGVEVLRAARRGWLRYDGRGLEGPGPYATEGVLNGVALGVLAPALADERPGAFSRNVGVPLSGEVLRSLGRRNRFELKNPRRDCFTVGRFWLELELPDGRRCSSDLCPAVLTQPPEWPPGEGIGVPFGRDIAVDLWFPGLH